MDERTLARVIAILEAHPDVYVTADELWETLRGEGLDPGRDQAAFTDEIAADGRFEILEPGDALDVPRIRVNTREVTTEDILSGLTRSVTRLTEALQEAWENRPDESPEAEAMLREALAMASQLSREVQEMTEAQEEAGDDEHD